MVFRAAPSGATRVPPQAFVAPLAQLSPYQLHNHRLAVGGDGTVEIIELHRATGISDHFALPVVNRDHDPPAHETRHAIETDSELRRGGMIDSSLCQIRMGAVHTGQSETQKGITPFFFPNQFPFDGCQAWQRSW